MCLVSDRTAGIHQFDYHSMHPVHSAKYHSLFSHMQCSELLLSLSYRVAVLADVVSCFAMVKRCRHTYLCMCCTAHWVLLLPSCRHMCQTSYVTPGKPLLGRHMLFFLLQAPLVLLERHRSQRSTPQVPATANAVTPSRMQQQSSKSRHLAAAAAPCTGAGGIIEGWGSKCFSASTGLVLQGPVVPQWQRAVQAVGTYTVLFVLADWLFWPPMESCKVDVNGIAEISDGLFWGRSHIASVFVS